MSAQPIEEAGTSICPGCALDMPRRPGALNTSYYHASAECWTVFGEVLAAEYSNAVLFGQVHQITVDAYAAQHAGGQHPDKSVGVHLSGLYLVLVKDVRPMAVAPMLLMAMVNTPFVPSTKFPECDFTMIRSADAP